MLREDFARFLKEPTREGLRNILKENTGEQNDLDFKEDWPSAGKLAKHILAFANFGVGCLIVGVREEEDTLTPIGISKLIDKTDIFKRIDKFLPDTLLSDDNISLFEFIYEESEYHKIKGKKFQVMLVKGVPEKVPYISPNEGDGINKNRIYTRRGIQTVEASYEEIQKIINARIETGYSFRWLTKLIVIPT